MTSDRYAYAQHSALSDPGDTLSDFADAPAELDALTDYCRNLVFHPFFLERAGVTPHPESRTDSQSRSVPRLAARLAQRQSAPFGQPRARADRFIGTCRDFSLLLVALLRQRGVPARVRVGLATYFTTGWWEDHWVAEVWPDGQWILVDAELGPEVRDEMHIDFDPLNVPRNRFLTAGPAWQALRQGKIPGDRIGVPFLKIAGSWFAVGSLQRDLAALNRIELLPWDYWGAALEATESGQISYDKMGKLDSLAQALSEPDRNGETLQHLFRTDPDFRLPEEIVSYSDDTPHKIPLAQAIGLA